MSFAIPNKVARHLWLDAQGLSQSPTGRLDVAAIIAQLGLVQLDTIQAVSRAHHHIIWSRNQNYREPMLNQLLADKRQIFEHYSHDACVLPIEMYPLWRRQFARFERKIQTSNWYSTMPDAKGRADIKARIAEEGPLCTKSFDTKTKSNEMWARPPHKLALDYMWHVGELATSHRKNFSKFYDLSEHVIPAHLRDDDRSDREQINYLCHQALDRLGFASEGDVARFWEAVSISEVKLWRERERGFVPVEVEGADGEWTKAFAPADIEQRCAIVPAPTSRLRILNPFDPVIRDRKRLMRLFGMEYRIEIFVPAAKRRWGYYVFPLLEGDRFVGRVDLKADRKAGQLLVQNFWPEPKVQWTPSRWVKLDAELVRLARLAEVTDVVWAKSF